MAEMTITDPEQVTDIEKLRDHVIKRILRDTRKPDGRQREFYPIPDSLLDNLDLGDLSAYRLSSDAVVCFICGDINFLWILYDRARYWLKLLIREDRIYVLSRDRMTGLEIDVRAFESELVM